MKIKEIKKYNIEVYQNNEMIYFGMSDDATDELKNCDIKDIKLENKCLKICI